MECIAPAKDSVNGAVIKQATKDACNAFTVFNQAFHGITTPDNPVPLYPRVALFTITALAQVPAFLSLSVQKLLRWLMEITPLLPVVLCGI
ncbi:hypothetical protein SE956_01335 [Escherichia coli]|nr:hypothetical protein [Escherichia coli]